VTEMTEMTVAAGALLWRPASGPPDGTDVLLVHRPKYDDWSLPKGKQEPGEHILLTAVREVLEETSVRPVLGPRLPTLEYLVNGRPKRVDYWSAYADGTEAAASHEIDEVAWLSLAQAAGGLSYSRDLEVIASLEPRPTVPLILARHVSAGDKDKWDGDDLLRPLDDAGVADAQLLAGLLACFAPRARVISSPAVRCMASMRPYADSFGGPVEADDDLTVLVRPADLQADLTDRPSSLRPLFRELVAAGQPAVVCLHRENLPLALAAACSALGASPARLEESLPKGGFLVLHAADGALVALDRYEL
jgi:8-oxo-dGTP pyrophosphatase MutT (NUDIX family)/phosphohistidine phosphatase SixA